MKKKTILALAVAMLCGISLFSSAAGACHFSPVDTTGSFSTILVIDVNIDGLPLQSGDEVGVFDGALCVGSAVYDGSDTLVIGAIMEVVLPPPGSTLPGAVVGHAVEFRIWRMSSDTELDGNPTFIQGGYFGDPVTVVNPLASSTSGIGDDGTATGPESFRLSQNYPNPFNPSTSVRFTLSNLETIHIVVYDMHGNRVRTLLDKKLPAGEHEILWDGTDSQGLRVGSGSYILKMEAGGMVQQRKLLLVK